MFVHGLGGSHLNWCLIGPRLAAGRRAVALDLHGFGLTPGTRATSTVQHNARLLDRFVREVTGTPVILVGNSMGGLISILQASAAPDTVAGLVLIDPALPPPRRAPDRQVGSQFLMYALPGIGELYVRSVHVPPAAATGRPARHRALLRRPVPDRPGHAHRVDRAGQPNASARAAGQGPRPSWPRPGR